MTTLDEQLEEWYDELPLSDTDMRDLLDIVHAHLEQMGGSLSALLAILDAESDCTYEETEEMAANRAAVIEAARKLVER